MVWRGQLRAWSPCTCGPLVQWLLSTLAKLLVLVQQRWGRSSRVRVQQQLMLSEADVCKVAAQLTVLKVSRELVEGAVVGRHGERAFQDQRGARRGQGRQGGPRGQGRHGLGGLGQGGGVAWGCGRRPPGATLARLAGGLGHLVFVDGGDGAGRHVAAFLLQEEVQFVLIIRVQLVALAGVVELAGAEGVERPSAGRVQGPPAGGQGAQAAPRRHGQRAGGEAGRGRRTVRAWTWASLAAQRQRPRTLSSRAGCAPQLLSLGAAATDAQAPWSLCSVTRDATATSSPSTAARRAPARHSWRKARAATENQCSQNKSVRPNRNKARSCDDVDGSPCWLLRQRGKEPSDVKDQGQRPGKGHLQPCHTFPCPVSNISNPALKRLSKEQSYLTKNHPPCVNVYKKFKKGSNIY